MTSSEVDTMDAGSLRAAYKVLMNEHQQALALLSQQAPAEHSAETVAFPQVNGIGRDTTHPRAVILYLRSEPTDDDIRVIQDALRAALAKHGEAGK